MPRLSKIEDAFIYGSILTYIYHKISYIISSMYFISESDRLTAEWKYLTKALQNVHTETLYGDLYYFPKDTKLSRMTYHSQRDEMEEKETDIFSLPSTMSKSKAETDSSLNSREYMGSMETILQTTIPYTSSQTFSEQIKSNYIHSDNIHDNSNVDNDNYADILTPQALLDHMEFLIKVRRLTITVGSLKWSFKDLCQRASLPFGVEMHHLQAYLDRIIPCIIITPLDCFWEGAKVLGPEEGMWVPWFDKRFLFQWTNIDPVGLLQDLSKRYGNYSQIEIKNLINLFHDSGIDHGYLNRSCLDPLDPACPVSAPNYRGKAPYISKILSGGCPGFASKLLHWPEEIIVGGRVHTNNSFDTPSHTNHRKVSFNLNQNKTRSSQFSGHFFSSSSVKFNKTSQGSKNLSYLIKANSLQSLILLRSPRDLYEAVRRNDPYKHEDWTLDDARHVLREWRRNLRRLIIEHNTGLQTNVGWQFFAFTSASLHDLLQEITLRLGPLTLIGCILLVFLYGVVCLLGWRDPVRSQCWLALCGLMIIALSSVAGLGICAAVGIPFNVLTIQVLPFLLLGLGVDSIFVLTTSFSLSSCSSKSSNPFHVLSVHGPSLLFGTISLAGAFFSAAFIPVPLIRQFCLQAGILIIVQSISVFMLFPVLLQLDATRRNQKRLDVFCCLRQPELETTIVSNPQKLTTFCQSESCHLRTFNYYSEQGSLQKCVNKSESYSESETTISSSLLVRFTRHFAFFITSHWSVQLCICLLGLGLFCAAVLCATFKLRLGLDWSSLTPSDTIEYGFIKTADQAFGLSNFHIIARGSDLPDFPMQQRRLRWMYDCLTSVSGVMLSGRKVWLDTMRDWLEEVQNAFDKDRKRGYIMDSGYWNANATELGILGLRLIVQTDRGPELSRINTGRIVRGDIIDPPAFYTLLRVWRSKDALNFSSLPCIIYPEPSIVHVGRLTGPGRPSDLHALSPAEPIEFVQTSFYAVGVSEMNSQLDLVQQIRHITETATVQGVPAFPTGVPFTFVEHYIYLVRETAIAFGIFCTVILFTGLILFSSPITVSLLLIVGAVGGACSAIIGLVILNLALNPISACLLLVSSGLGARISVGFLGSWPVSHLYTDSSSNRSTRKICLCQFNSSYGCTVSDSVQFCTRVHNPKYDSKQITLSKSPSSAVNTTITVSKRRQLVRGQIVRILSNHFTPAFHATVGLLLALSLLVAARVQFIADYFFRLIVIVSFVCLFNAVCLIPTICYLIGPFHSRFILGGRRNVSNITSTSHKSPIQRDDTNYPSHIPPVVDKTIQYLKCHPSGINVNSEQHINMISDSQSSFSSSPSNMSPSLSSPSSSRSSSSFSHSEQNHNDEFSQNMKLSSITESMYKESNCSTMKESPKVIVHHSLNYSNDNSTWMNRSNEQYISLNPTASFNSVDSIKNYFTPQNLPLSLVTSVDLFRMSRLLNPNISANEICESLYSSITSPASSNIHTSVKSHRTSRNRELVLDPNVACTLLAAVTATSYQTANKPVVEVTPVGQNENTPPPSYSSVVNQSHSIGHDRSSERISVSSHQQRAYRDQNISTRLSDNEISVKSFTNYHHLKKKNVSLVFSSPTHINQTTPINTSSSCKISQLPNTGSNSSTTHLNVNISHSCRHNHRHCSNCLITHCNSRSINDNNSSSNHNANANIHHQSTGHTVLSSSNSDSQIKKSHNT
ncbi:putative patched 1 [Schistosoma mansoni]|uniref:putative patched 1 n=1 Tax=Schistosoma mansoni TaxID=6183 RepID=UPI0001A63B84|nr:putative patched 1 [Schistosoma mansoni]|eukprot:XP_018654842.1 putative patched 1 [Schistosoma mansoni]